MKNQRELLQHIVELEKRLHQPASRRDKQTVENLLHAEFTEIGRSGTLTRRTDIIDTLHNEQSQPMIQSEGYELSAINDSVVILT